MINVQDNRAKHLEFILKTVGHMSLLSSSMKFGAILANFIILGTILIVALFYSVLLVGRKDVSPTSID